MITALVCVAAMAISASAAEFVPSVVQSNKAPEVVSATDKDGNKELEAGKEVTIIDTVTLEGLEVGTQYKLVGWQMLKEENAELLINGKRVESDYMFTADSETMKVEVAFTLDATSLDGKQLVTFEELYDLSNPDDPKKVTEHKDIEDKGQTITFKEKPKEPEKPETPPTPEKPNRPSDSPKTGDNTIQNYTQGASSII